MSTSVDLPSLFAFQPRYYRGGAIRHHLALLYDLVATRRPPQIVVVGFEDGEAFFTLCQAVRELQVNAKCMAIWRGAKGETRDADEAWEEGKRYAAENYGDFAQLVSDDSETAAKKFAEQKVDLLLVDQCERGAEVTATLNQWSASISSGEIVLVHGIELNRPDAPGNAWRQWLGERPSEEFSAGIGMGVTARDERSIPKASATEQLYALATARIEAQAQSEQSQRDLAALSARQVWLDSLLEDRWTAQEIMDEQGRQMEELRKRFEELGR
ncbi:MAG TPA: class I SAM-dependent methyltransferase, partial [Chthoniobacterales bacterium]